MRSVPAGDSQRSPTAGERQFRRNETVFERRFVGCRENIPVTVAKPFAECYIRFCFVMAILDGPFQTVEALCFDRFV